MPDVLPDRDALRSAVTAWYGDDPVRARVRIGAMNIQACRLFECGYEAHISEYGAADLILLSTMTYPYQMAVLLVTAIDRADAKLLYCLESAGISLEQFAVLRRASQNEPAP